MEGPSAINPLIIWQQPHPIMLAELLYRACPERSVLARYADVVFESAEFMASFVRADRAGRFVLGPPIVPAQENHDPRAVLNPAFELAYWDFGLRTAITWRERLGRPRDAVDALLMDCPKNTYLPNGHNAQAPRADLPVYLPGNGALLTAVAAMAAGWDGHEKEPTPHDATPGFPTDAWRVAWEGLLPTP